MHRLCISLVVALACLLALSEAQKDAFVRDQLIVYRIGDTDNPASPTGTKTVPIYFDYYDRTTGAKLNSIAVRTSDALGNSNYYKCTHSQTAAYSGHLALGLDKSQIGFGCFRADVGTTSPENSDSRVINRVVSFLGSNGFVDTGTPIGYMEGDAGVGKGYITSVITPLSGTYGPVSCLTSFYGNSLRPFYGIRMIDRFFGIFNWKQTSDYSGDNVRALTLMDPDSLTTTVAYTTPGMAWRYIQQNVRNDYPFSTVYAASTIPNDPNGIVSIPYGGNYFYYMTDASAPQRIYKAFSKNALNYNSFYLNNDGGEYFGITGRLVSTTVYLYVTYRPAGAVYSEVWEFTDTAGEGSFDTPLSRKKLFRSDDNQLFKGIAFSPVNAKCRDGKQDSNYDSGIDCGGAVCLDKCGSGSPCVSNADCDSNSCSNGFCAAATCGDNVLNQGEIDTDCGGPNCAKCAAGKSCYAGTDCDSLVCNNGKCTTATCVDGIQNSDEIGPDCGGALCAQGGKSKCPNNVPCTSDAMCVSGYCSVVDQTCQSATCFDGVQNGLETDIDCGPLETNCPRCFTAKKCDSFDDCDSWVCLNGKCQDATCHDGQDNGFEPPSGDCGQWCKENDATGVLCNVGQRCWTAFDCNNVACGDIDYINPYRGKFAGTCKPASCTDGFKNNFETDIDCGGPVCTRKCPLAKGCSQNSDCEDNYCNSGKCDIPRCDDGIKNGVETDVDCGGTLCAQALNMSCATGEICVLAIDCDFYNKIYCINGRCNPLPTPAAPVAAPQGSNTPSFVPFSAPPVPDICSTCTAPTAGCDYDIPACIGGRINTIIQCVEVVNGKYYAFFSYENIFETEATLTPTINFVNLDVEGGNLPMTFQPGRHDIFPKVTFVGTSVNPTFAEWYADGMILGFDLNMPELACPSDFVFQLISSSDAATLNGELQSIIDALSNLLGVSSAQLNITITPLVKRAGGSSINIEVTSASAIAIYSFVNSGGIDTLNTNVPVVTVTDVSSNPLPTEIKGNTPPQAVGITPQSAPAGSPGGSTPSGSGPSGSNSPISKPVSGAEQLAVCGVLSVALLALIM